MGHAACNSGRRMAVAQVHRVLKEVFGLESFRPGQVGAS